MSCCDKRLGELNVVRCWMQVCFKYTSFTMGERLGKMLDLIETLLEVLCEKLCKVEGVKGWVRHWNRD